jgi:ribosomal protein L11 methylase PrmA
MTSADPGSFRDPASQVVIDGARVIRVLDQRGLEAWRALSGTGFYRNAVADGRLIAATELEDAPEGAVGALEHPLVPFISYPYEWTFSMLKDAALLHLDLLEEALGEGLTIKDATPYNIQFVDGRPVFIDIGSFEAYRAGEPWIGYRQFTRQFLFPLMLQAWVGAPFQPWLRGDIEGPTPAQMRSLLAGRKRFNTGALFHVRLQARMEAGMSDRAVRQDLKSAGFNKDLILANVRKLKKLVGSLRWDHGRDGWSDYGSCTHVSRDRSAKTEFLQASLDRWAPSRVLDLGANDGHFSVVAASSGALAVAVDGDQAVLDELYLRSSGQGLSIALTDLANPSPSQGWSGVERPGVFERARPGMVIAYGLIHHLIYGASVPPRRVIDWLRGFDCPVVVEFVAPEDEMVLRLVGNKLPEELHPEREESDFRRLATACFTVVDERRLSPERVLFALEPM